MELFNELLAEIERIPAVDIHSRVYMTSPAAADLSEIIFTPQIEMELRAARVPVEILEMEGARKKVYEAAPYLEKIKNTTTYWCLAQIYADLFKSESEPYNSDPAAIYDKVEQTANDPNWTLSVLDKANISKVLAACQWHRPIPQATDKFAPVVVLDKLISEPFMTRTLEGLTEATDQAVYEVADLKKAITQLFRNIVDAKAAAVSASFNPQVDFEQSDRDAADRILSLVLLGQRANREDRRALRSYVMDLVLSACAEHGMPFQLMLGVQKGVAGERAISAFETGMLSGYTSLFTRHSEVKFDIFTANATLAHDLAVVARNYPNVYVSGYLDYLIFPTHIRRILRERVEMLPITKSSAFFSEAPCVEWVYARAKLIRQELAFTLSQMVAERYITMTTAVDVARHYLLENPKRIYHLE